MTLILSINTPKAAVHASDRRVTRVGLGRSPAIYSPLENKTLIFLTDDAVGTMGFTGIAFIGEQPTDQWIANKIAPQPDGSPPLGSFVFGGRGFGRLRLRTIVRRLVLAMADLPWKLRKYGLAIQIGGYRIRRHRSVPFCIEIEWKGGAPAIDGWMRLPRTRQQKTIVSQIGDGWSVSKTWQAMVDYAETTGRQDIEAIREAAIATIRERAGETSTVGSDLMTVVVPNPLVSREIVWRFEPLDLHEGAIVGPNIDYRFAAIYSPWIITPWSVACPSIGTGGGEIEAGGFTIRCGNDAVIIEGQRRGPRIFGAFTHQRRMPAP
jgi:hypothetical protein